MPSKWKAEYAENRKQRRRERELEEDRRRAEARAEEDKRRQEETAKEERQKTLRRERNRRYYQGKLKKMSSTHTNDYDGSTTGRRPCTNATNDSTNAADGTGSRSNDDDNNNNAASLTTPMNADVSSSNTITLPVLGGTLNSGEVTIPASQLSSLLQGVQVPIQLTQNNFNGANFGDTQTINYYNGASADDLAQFKDSFNERFGKFAQSLSKRVDKVEDTVKRHLTPAKVPASAAKTKQSHNGHFASLQEDEEEGLDALSPQAARALFPVNLTTKNDNEAEDETATGSDSNETKTETETDAATKTNISIDIEASTEIAIEISMEIKNKAATKIQALVRGVFHPFRWYKLVLQGHAHPKLLDGDTQTHRTLKEKVRLRKQYTKELHWRRTCMLTSSTSLASQDIEIARQTLRIGSNDTTNGQPLRLHLQEAVWGGLAETLRRQLSHLQAEGYDTFGIVGYEFDYEKRQMFSESRDVVQSEFIDVYAFGGGGGGGGGGTGLPTGMAIRVNVVDEQRKETVSRLLFHPFDQLGLAWVPLCNVLGKASVFALSVVDKQQLNQASLDLCRQSPQLSESTLLASMQLLLPGSGEFSLNPDGTLAFSDIEFDIPDPKDKNDFFTILVEAKHLSHPSKICRALQEEASSYDLDYENESVMAMLSGQFSAKYEEEKTKKAKLLLEMVAVMGLGDFPDLRRLTESKLVRLLPAGSVNLNEGCTQKQGFSPKASNLIVMPCKGILQMQQAWRRRKKRRHSGAASAIQTTFRRYIKSKQVQAQAASTIQATFCQYIKLKERETAKENHLPASKSTSGNKKTLSEATDALTLPLRRTGRIRTRKVVTDNDNL